MLILWIVYEIALIIADAIFFCVAKEYWNVVKVGKAKLQMARTVDGTRFLQAKITEAKLDFATWLVMSIVGLWAIMDNLVNNICK